MGFPGADTISGMRLFVLLATASTLAAQTGENVLLVVNGNDASSREIGEYYQQRRSVPVKNICTISTTSEEEIDWATYEQQVETPIGACLKKNALQEKVLYIVTTLGVPLKVKGAGSGMTAEYCAVDSELALLYGKMKGAKFERSGMVPNPLFRKRDEAFRH